MQSSASCTSLALKLTAGTHVSAGVPHAASRTQVGNPTFRHVTLALTAAGFSTFTVTVNRLKVSDPSLRGIWRGLRRALDGKSIAIVGLDGAERHWTVVYAATERTLRVADSSGLGMIFRSQCTVGRTSVRYQLRPSEVLVVRRERA